MALRKKSALRTMREPAKDEELLMFGYQCNVFRDDEKALFIDQGKHLIPWNGDDTIMIDRYDVRAYLSDLTEYDTDVIRKRHEPLTDKERHLEAILDEERYLELRTDVTEKMMYEEEEMKRLNEAVAGNSYGAVGFNYEEPVNSTDAADGDDDQASLTYDQPYTVIPGLPLPPDLTLPATMKVHAIIEKTASFVAKQGIQMEIILKTKQKNNQQFEFLNYDNEMNPYYRHLVKVIKQGKYQPAPPLVQQESEEHDDSHSYLHPSLTSAEIQEPEPSPITSQEFLESIQSKLPAGQIANTSYAILLNNLKKHANVVIHKPTDSHQTAGQSADSAKLGAAPPPPPPPPVISQSQPLLSPADASPVNYREESPEGEQKRKPKKRPRDASDQSPSKAESKRKKDLVHGPLIIPPPPDQQPIIDKMADYVARNGPEFEMVVRMKNDERFRFLDSGHIHHNYYEYKKQIFLKEMEAQKLEEANKENEEQLESGCEVEPKTSKSNDGEEAAVATETEKDDVDDKAANVSKAVSFSIKVKEEEVTSLKTRTALLYESSDDEDEDGSTESETASLASRSLPHSLSRSSLASTTVDKQAGNSEELEKKQAEHRLADRLAAAAREKLARESKERQLQAQRKRKAAMFINMLKDMDGATGTGTAAGTAAPAEDVGTDGFGGSVDSPFGSSLASRSVTPTLFLEQVTSSLNATVMSVQPVVSAPTTKPTSAAATPSRSSHSSQRRPRSRSRDRSRPSKRHRKHSNTPPTAYTHGRRPSSKSPTSSRHESHSHSKHRLKHSQVHATSHSHAESKPRRKDDAAAVGHKRKSRSRSSERKSKKESGSKKSSNKSHKKKSSKDQGTSHHHKSKKHKSKSKHRRSLSSSPEDQKPSKQSKPSVDRNNPDVVDLTGSPRAEDIGSRFAY